MQVQKERRNQPRAFHSRGHQSILHQLQTCLTRVYSLGGEAHQHKGR